MGEKRDYIPLQHCHVNQHTTKGQKGEWQIEENMTNKNLGSLPSNLNHTQIFSILDIMRKYELEAWNKGIVFGKEKERELNRDREREANALNQELTKENERLADILDRMTKKEHV